MAADQRRYYAAGTLEAERVAELDGLGMVWAVQTPREDILAVARSYAAVHGHFVPPTTAVWEGQIIGHWARNQRQAARRTVQNALRRAAGETGVPSTGELTQARQEALDAVDPGWRPAWDAGWQRALRLCQNHVRAGGTLPSVAGEAIVHGEDLGAWAAAQRAEWEQRTPAQQHLLETLGLEPPPATDDGAGTGAVRPAGRRDQARAVNLTAARQFHEREGHLRVPRKHVEALPDGTEVKLGTVIDNTRRRATALTDQQHQEWTALGMRW
ncbi:helicase associated domain-containing protein [Streptomyces seoulensis]